MAQTVLITLTTAGADTGPFDLYSNVDGFASPFENNISKIDLVAGYVSNLVPDVATTIRAKSDNPVCGNHVDMVIATTTTTTSTTAAPTTTTTTTTPPPTTTTTTTLADGEFMLDPLFGMNIENVTADSGTIPAFSFPRNSGNPQTLTMVSGFTAGTTFTVNLSGTRSPASNKRIQLQVNGSPVDCSIISIDGSQTHFLTSASAILISNDIKIVIDSSPTC